MIPQIPGVIYGVEVKREGSTKETPYVKYYGRIYRVFSDSLSRLNLDGNKVFGGTHVERVSIGDALKTLSSYDPLAGLTYRVELKRCIGSQEEFKKHPLNGMGNVFTGFEWGVMHNSLAAFLGNDQPSFIMEALWKLYASEGYRNLSFACYVDKGSINWAVYQNDKLLVLIQSMEPMQPDMDKLPAMIDAFVQSASDKTIACSAFFRAPRFSLLPYKERLAIRGVFNSDLQGMGGDFVWIPNEKD